MNNILFLNSTREGSDSISFVAICDHDLLSLAVASFRAEQRSFVHVMTLDTHLPLRRPTFPCKAEMSPGLCSYEEAMKRTLGDIVSVLSTAAIKPEMVALYGDHMPPFFAASDRARFVKGQVPFVLLTRTKQPRESAFDRTVQRVVDGPPKVRLAAD